MPRLPHFLHLRAKHISPLLPLVLRGTRTLQSAKNELRWLREHVNATSKTQDDLRTRSLKLFQLCRRRAMGEPLQYILGSQPFGDLDIKCRPGVLIPRPETEAYATHLAKLLLENRVSVKLKPENSKDRSLRILDLCSGTGCISLLLQSLLSSTFPALQIQGWDISPNAVSLARENLNRNVAAGTLRDLKEPSTEFHLVDIFDDIEVQKSRLKTHGRNSTCDIIISNPPYISQEAFNKETARSVRNWEPRLALVPQRASVDFRFAQEDVFYHRLLVLYESFGSRILAMEVGDDEQALRVASMAFNLGVVGDQDEVQIWRDAPGCSSMVGEAESLIVQRRNVRLIGAGKLRAVVLFRGIAPEARP